MSDNKTATLQAVLQLALPLGTNLLTGAVETTIVWAVTLRARPPVFSEIYGGELALVSMELLQTYDSRITLADVIRSLAQVGVPAVACPDPITEDDVQAAQSLQVCLLALPADSNLTRIERDVNALIANYAAQVNQRVLEVQRQLTRVVMENRDIASLLQMLARATARSILLHDTAGLVTIQRDPDQGRRPERKRTLPYGVFQNWLERFSPDDANDIVSSPLGYTAVLRVEKRIAGYLTLLDQSPALDDFTRMVFAHGADACAIELAKSRAVAYAVEQARGDWVQMWLSGVSSDLDLMTTRARQSGFAIDDSYVIAVFLAAAQPDTVFTLESLASLVRGEMTRLQINGAVGQYVDVIVALYPLENGARVDRQQAIIEEMRLQLASRLPNVTVAAGVSGVVSGMSMLRAAYREARDAISIAQELGTSASTTFYGDLQLFRLLLALKETSQDDLRRFHAETLGRLIEHDNRRDSELIRTLEGFFQANGNLAKAASDLAVHRNTLVYRLERITELTGVNLDDADNRLILHLALKIQRVLAVVSG